MKTQLLCLPALILGGWFATVESASAQVTLLTTFTNPTPANRDLFSWSVAAVGNNRVLISAYLDDTGATNAGAAYLFSTNGTLLTTFTNPTPTVDDRFGNSVTAVGNDRVLIGTQFNDTGAEDAGVAYLFGTDGTLLTIFTNPTPANFDNFGNSVAAVGNDLVLIGAPRDDTGAQDAGAAYLFSTNGTLLTTFTNPTPPRPFLFDYFGSRVAALGNDRVLITAPNDNTGAIWAGAVYLFNTNGTLLTTFTNPTPAAGHLFGSSVAAVGSKWVLIGEPYDDKGASNAGAVYLFTTNGTLLRTFMNPTPAASNYFGWSVAAVGNDRVLIGAPYYDNAHSDGAIPPPPGAAYLFSIDGTLLTNYAKPAPVAGDLFGWSVAAVGNDRVLIGAYGDDTGAMDAGAAYLFAAPVLTAPTITQQPVTQVVTAGQTATFTSKVSGFPAPALRWQRSIDSGTTWSNLTAGFIGTTAEFQISSTTTNQSGHHFRLTATNSAGSVISAAAKLIVITNIVRRPLKVFTNPAPANADYFGKSLASVGTNLVLIGVPNDDPVATDAGAAYLFNTKGALLTTFTKPKPADHDYFGWSVAAVGNDRVLIGAYGESTTGALHAGAAYLFSTNGTLLANFTNPAPATFDYFGNSVAAVGDDRVLIGAFLDDTGNMDSGAAYLFSTNGTLLTTFIKPAPLAGDFFGWSVASVGNDRVLIGTPNDHMGAPLAGAAYLFGANGTLLTTFTNPVPVTGKNFGWSVAAVGNDRVIIGTPGYATGVMDAGAAYLFSTDGALLTAFTNPTPAFGNNFGYSVAAVGSDRVLIGAPYHGEMITGAAYLFSTSGTLLATFTDPAPESGDSFGSSVGALGNDQVLIGASGNEPGASIAGAAYLFRLNVQRRPLNIMHIGTDISISWIIDDVSLILQETGLLGTPTIWSDTGQPVTTIGLTNVVQQTIGNTNRFYRLRRP